MSGAHRLVRIYGKENILFALANPMLSFFAAARAVRPPATPEERILERAERDGQRLANEGHRVISSEWYETPLLRTCYLRVLYERP